MKMIVLATPTWVANPFAIPGGVLGDVRSPQDGPQTVTDEVAADLAAQGLLAEDPVHLPGFDEITEDLEAMTLPDLGILVTKEGVPLNGATKKADIIAAIRAHRAAAS